MHQNKHKTYATAIDIISSDQRWPQYVAAISASTFGLVAGVILGWLPTAKILIIPPEGNSTNFKSQYNFEITETHLSWVVTVFEGGAAFSSLFMGCFQSSIGPKIVLIWVILPFLIGWTLISCAHNLATLLIGRLFCGTAIGSVIVTAPSYISEIADKRIRGQLGAYFHWFGTIGIFLAYGIGASKSLLVLNVISFITPLICGVVFLFMPESPYYLVHKHRFHDAVLSLRWLNGKNYNPTYAMKEILLNDQTNKMDRSSIWKILRSKASIKALYISIGLLFFTQWAGINAVTFYADFIFHEPYTTVPMHFTLIMAGGLQTISTFVASFLVDRLGRRFLLIISVTVMQITTILLGVYFYLEDIKHPYTKHINWLPMFSLCSFIVAYAFGFGPVPFIIIGEIFSHKINKITASLAISSWFLIFLISKLYTDMTDIGTCQKFWLFTGFSFVALIFVLFFVPETKGKSLREIQEMLELDGYFVKLC